MQEYDEADADAAFEGGDDDGDNNNNNNNNNGGAINARRIARVALLTWQKLFFFLF